MSSSGVSVLTIILGAGFGAVAIGGVVGVMLCKLRRSARSESPSPAFLSDHSEVTVDASVTTLGGGKTISDWIPPQTIGTTLATGVQSFDGFEHDILAMGLLT
jgi:uncharacterized protein (DUF58 family)